VQEDADEDQDSNDSQLYPNLTKNTANANLLHKQGAEGSDDDYSDEDDQHNQDDQQNEDSLEDYEEDREEMNEDEDEYDDDEFMKATESKEPIVMKKTT
jgi:hypothetical protein